MGIHPDIFADLLTIPYSARKQAVHLPVAGQPVDGHIGRVVQPMAAFYIGISRVLPFKQRKHPVNPGFVKNDFAYVLPDIKLNQRLCRIKCPIA